MDRAVRSFCTRTEVTIVVQDDLISTNSKHLAEGIMGCLAGRTQERCAVTLDLKAARWIDGAGMHLIETLGQKVSAECHSTLTVLVSRPDLVRVMEFGMLQGVVNLTLIPDTSRSQRDTSAPFKGLSAYPFP